MPAAQRVPGEIASEKKFCQILGSAILADDARIGSGDNSRLEMVVEAVGRERRGPE